MSSKHSSEELKTKSQKTKFLTYLILIPSSIIVSLIFILFLIFSWFIFSKKQNDAFRNNISYYRITHYNKLSDKSSFGIVKIPSKILRNDEFLSLRSNSETEYSVISSKFSNDEYECFGKCACENVNSRRSVNVLSKSLYFAISAISLSLAIKIASSYFSEECFLSFRNNCPIDTVVSEIDFCEKKNEDNFLSHEMREDISVTQENELRSRIRNNDQVVAKKEESTGFRREFHCYGYCVKNGNLRLEVTLYESEKFQCEKHTIEGKVTVVETSKLGFLAKSSYQGHDKAKTLFQKRYLGPYCKYTSVFEYNYVYVSPKGKKAVKKREASLCVGTGVQNISCRLVRKFAGGDGKRENQKLKQQIE